MLGRYQHRCNADGAVSVIFHRHLRFAIRQQERQFAGSAYRFQLLGQLMRQLNGQRHQGLCLLAGIAKHHALVTCTGIQQLRLPAAGDAPCNVGRLVMQIYCNGAGICIKAASRLRIADFGNDLLRNSTIVDLGFAGNLTENVHLVFGTGHLAGNTGIGILRQQFVQNLVRHLIADLVRMAAGHGFRCEQHLIHSIAS